LAEGWEDKGTLCEESQDRQQSDGDEAVDQTLERPNQPGGKRWSSHSSFQVPEQHPNVFKTCIVACMVLWQCASSWSASDIWQEIEIFVVFVLPAFSLARFASPTR